MCYASFISYFIAVKIDFCEFAKKMFIWIFEGKHFFDIFFFFLEMEYYQAKRNCQFI